MSIWTLLVAGLGNAVGLLRNVHLGALQYQSCIAQFLDGGNSAHSSLRTMQKQLEQQCASGICRACLASLTAGASCFSCHWSLVRMLVFNLQVVSADCGPHSQQRKEQAMHLHLHNQAAR